MSSPRAFKRGKKVDAFTNVNAKPHEVTAEDRATVLRLHQAGKTYREIAANTRVDRWMVEAIVTAWGKRADEQIAWLEGA